MFRLAITGGIACGKSMMATFMESRGVAVLDSDDIAHRLLEEDGPVARAVLDEFGRGILGPSGKIDRVKLGQLVFSRESARVCLNAIMHPVIRQEWESWLGTQADRAVCAVVIPLLFEAGFHTGWDAIVCVMASRETQIRRLQSRGLHRADADARIDSQMVLQEKVVRADFVVVNDGTPTLLEEQVVRVLSRVMEKNYAR